MVAHDLGLGLLAPLDGVVQYEEMPTEPRQPRTHTSSDEPTPGIGLPATGSLHVSAQFRGERIARMAEEVTDRTPMPCGEFLPVRGEDHVVIGMPAQPP